jgi:tripartite-type tricarboxylate transporter receptor subunit TctC
MNRIVSINPCPRRTGGSRLMSALSAHFATALVLGLGMAIAAPAGAQAFPSRPVRLVVPFAAGGVTDVMARLIGGEMARHLGQPVTVDNRAGAGGAIAAEHVAKSPPDGYTLCFCTTGPMALIPILDARLPYDPLRDLAPVSHLHNVDNVIIARPTLPASSVAELVALARSNPDKLTYGTPGIGGPQHLSGELLNTMAGIRLVHVPFKGEAPSITDLMGGQIDLVFASVLAAVPHIKSGKVKAVAVPHRTRAELLPDVPTVAESGYPGYEISNFVGINAPAGTPGAVIERLYESVAAAIAQPAVRQRMVAEGLTPVGSRPEAYEAFLRSEHQKWSGVIRQAGLTRQ